MIIERPSWIKYKAKLFTRDLISFAYFIALAIKEIFIKNKEVGIRILVYHSISGIPKTADPLRMTVPPELFKKQIKYLLHRGYNILSLDSILEYLCNDKKITGKEIALTFDDGFADNLEPARNVLNKNGLTATYFLSYNYIGAKEMPRWPGMEKLHSKPLTLDNVKELISINMSLGSHTLTHPNLVDISSNAIRLYDEIAKSKQLLEDRFNMPIKYFAYPFGNRGSYNKITECVIKESGYKAAFTNIFGANRKGDNLYTLKRTRISWNDTLFKFKLKLSGAYDWVDNFII